MSRYMYLNVNNIIDRPFIKFDDKWLREIPFRNPRPLIEQANGDVFNVMLGVVPIGAFTGGQVHTVDFKNTVIVTTINIGYNFIYWVDGVLIFHRLTKEQLQRILEIPLHGLQQLLAEGRIELELGDSAKKVLHPESGG